MKKMTTKRQLAMFLALMMTLLMAFTGCGGGDDDGAEDTDGDLPTIGIVSISDHTSLVMIRDAIEEQLAADGYIDGETVTIDYQSAQGQASNLKTICQKFTSKNYDMIIAIATPSAQMALGETTEIPIVFSAVTDPVSAELVDSMEQPGGNVTGTSDAVSASQIMDLARKLTPDIKTIGAVYCTSEINSLSVIEDLKAYAAEHDLTVVEAPITTGSELKDAATSLVGKVDAVFSPIDNEVANSMPAITQVLDAAQIPFYVSADSMVMDGGFATYGINYVALGTETALMAADILEGAYPGTMPVRTIDDLQIYINTDVAERIGVEIPQDILDQATVFTDDNSGNN